MAFDVHANLSLSTVATAPSPAGSGTTLTVAAGHGARFPSTFPYRCTVWPTGTTPDPTNAEIVRVTARTTDTLTIVRTVEAVGGSSSARSIVVGDNIALTVTAGNLQDVEGALTLIPARRVVKYSSDGLALQVLSDTGTVTGTYTFAGLGAATARTAIQAAINECDPGFPSTTTVPTASGGTFVNRGAVALGPGRYVIDTTLTVGYWCSAIYGLLPPTVDRATAVDELLAGSVLEWGGGSGAANGVRTATTKQHAGTTATLTTSVAHGFQPSQSVVVALSGADAQFDGTVTILTCPTATTFTYTLGSSTSGPTATGGTVTTTGGTSDLPHTLGMTCLLRIGAAAFNATRKADNPHGFRLRDISFAATATPTQFSFVQSWDTNDVLLERCTAAGNKGTGCDVYRVYSTLAPDAGGVASKIHDCFFRDIYRGVVIPAESTGATDGEIYNTRMLAYTTEAIHSEAGGWFIHGGHYTSNASGALNSIYLVGGGPSTISGIYFDSIQSAAGAAHIRIASGEWNVVGCHFHLGPSSVQTQCIDASTSSGWKSEFHSNEIFPNGSTSLQCFVRFPNSVKAATQLVTLSAVAASGATTLTVAALATALAIGDRIRFQPSATSFYQSVTARVTAAASASATSVTVAALPQGIPNASVGTTQAVQVDGSTLHNGGQATGWLGFAVTVDNTVLDHTGYHAVANNRDYT